MLATVIPTLTNEFHTVSDISRHDANDWISLPGQDSTAGDCGCRVHHLRGIHESLQEYRRITMVQEAGATNARDLIPADQDSGFLKAYNQAVTESILMIHVYYFPTAACALGGVLSFALVWTRISNKGDDKTGMAIDYQ
ncbi:hypothetical protein ARSEF4850_009584 [Beauveria asiatica]